ncbi:hypothetical protein LBMAG42_49440 [Deltaproteobacteria bacterium]|nr:hypothetical protein LBMAG42_49440 [Deltaproteobacteria bacterium]
MTSLLLPAMFFAACVLPQEEPGAADVGDDTAATEVVPPSAAYLIVTVPALEGVAARWAEYREATGYAVTTVLTKDLVRDTGDGEEVAGEVEREARALAKQYPDRPVHILLLGDVTVDGEDGIPGTACKNDLGYCYTDNEYAGRSMDGVPTYAVGRIPAGSEAAATAALEKQIAFEAEYAVGEFNRRIFFYAGESGWDASLTELVESMVMMGLTKVDPAYDIIGLYNDPNSSYYYTPFDEKVVELFNEGSVFAMYLGHGSSAYNDGLSVHDIESLDAQGRLPYLALFACSNGEYYLPSPSVAEAAFAVDGGPIGVLAASGLSHPYGNAVFPYELQRSLFSGAFTTVGESLVDAKRQVMENEDEVRGLLDFYGSTEGLSDGDMARLREQHLDLYNYMGDPASPLLLPPARVTLEVEGESYDGALLVRGTVPNVEEGTAKVTFEVPIDQILGDLEDINVYSPDPATVQTNWATAIDKVVVAVEVPVSGGAFEATLTFDNDLPGADYFVKAYVSDGKADAVGAAAVR